MNELNWRKHDYGYRLARGHCWQLNGFAFSIQLIDYCYYSNWNTCTSGLMGQLINDGDGMGRILLTRPIIA